MNPTQEAKAPSPKPLIIRSAPARGSQFAKLDPTALASVISWGKFVEEMKDVLPKNLQKFLTQLQNPLRKLALAVNKSGGWLRVIGANKWHLMPACHCPDARRDYDKFLFPLLKTLEYRSYGMDFPKRMKPQCVLSAPVVTPPASGELNRAFWSEVLDRDVSLLRGFTRKVWRIDPKLYSMDYLEIKRGAEAVSTAGEPATVRDFVALMRTRPEETPATLQVALHIGGWEDHVTDLMSHFPEILLCGSRFDLLSYARRHVPGATLPQLTLRVAGCWTGTQTAPLGMSQVIVNHGPGVAEWWIIDASNATRFRDFFLRQEGVDFWREPQWWPSENLIMTEGLSVKYVRQLPGDILFLGPGVVLWTKNKSATVVLKWAVGRKTKKQVDCAFERDSIDRNLARGSGLGIYTLAMDLLNAEMDKLDEDTVRSLATRLENRFREEKKAAEETGFVNMSVSASHDITDCSHCRSGIFYAYCVCDVCAVCVCLSCVGKHAHSLSMYYTSVASEGLERLFQRVQSRLSGPLQDCFDPSLCLRFDQLQKAESAGAFLSPEKGQPSFTLFHPEDEEKTKPRKRRREKAAKKARKKAARHQAAMQELAALLDPADSQQNEDNDSLPSKKAKYVEDPALEVTADQIRD